MKNIPTLVCLFSLLIFSGFSIKLFHNHDKQSAHTKDNHHGKLTNFSFSNFNVNFSGASGTYYDDRLVSIQFKFVDLDSGAEIKSEYYGPKWGYSFDWSVPKDDKVKRIYFWKDYFMVNGMQFETENGVKSPLFGAESGTYSVEKLKGVDIVGF